MNEWCVGNVTDMSNLFDGLGEFDEDISKWDTGRVTTMEKVSFFCIRTCYYLHHICNSCQE